MVLRVPCNPIGIVTAMNTVENEIIRDFKQRVRDRVGPCRMVLFGSRARGDAQADSDMDILVEFEQSIDSHIRSLVNECAWEACLFKGTVLTPISVNRREWREGPESASLLAIAIRREGIEV